MNFSYEEVGIVGFIALLVVFSTLKYMRSKQYKDLQVQAATGQLKSTVGASSSMKAQQWARPFLPWVVLGFILAATLQILQNTRGSMFLGVSFFCAAIFLLFMYITLRQAAKGNYTPSNLKTIFIVIVFGLGMLSFIAYALQGGLV